MYDTVINEYEMIDVLDTSGYNDDVYRDPEFYGISYEEYSMIKYLNDESINDDGTFDPYAMMSDNLKEQMQEASIKMLKESGKLYDPEFIAIAREEGLGEIIDELLESFAREEEEATATTEEEEEEGDDI